MLDNQTYTTLCKHAKKHPIILHVKRKGTALLPKLIQFFSYITCTYSLYSKLRLDENKRALNLAFKRAKRFNVNHTACVFYSSEFEELYVFQNNKYNNCHILPLSKYLETTDAEIRADILLDKKIIQDILYEHINFLSKNILYSVKSAIGSYSIFKKSVNESNKLQQYCTQSILDLYEKICINLEFSNYTNINKQNDKITPRELCQALYFNNKNLQGTIKVVKLQ